MTDQLDRLKTALADRYTIERVIGSGGMATVYLAEDLRNHRKVAIKVLRPDLAATLGGERFLREIEIAANLQHPHILPLHDSGEADGLLYYTMPFIEGESLRDRLNRERQLPIDDALQITKEVADALGYAHSLGIVHRDIKPENILFTAGHAVVSDFGIARAVTVAGGETLTETGLAIGTPLYMSPEQASGEKEVDGRSDLYSLGCVLYEMLSGDPPYTAQSHQALIAKKLNEPTPRISVVRELVPGPVEAALTKALAKTPADRFRTAAQLVEALSVDAAAFARRQRVRRVAFGVAALLVVAASATVALYLSPSCARAPTVPTLAVLPFDNVGADSDQAYLSDALAQQLTASLARIYGLKVIGTQSTTQYGQDRPPLREIGRTLDAQLIIKGSVLEVGAKVQIAVQLVAASTGHPRWSDTYDGDLSDVLVLLSDVARAVAAQVEVVLTEDDEERLAVAPTTKPQVMDAVLRAHHLMMEAFSPESYSQAIRLLEQALDLDPAFAPAWGGLAQARTTLVWFGGGEPADEMPQAEQAVRRALALDAGDVDAQMALGDVARWRMEWADAERAYRAALARDPSRGMAAVRLINLLIWMGRYDEAEMLARKTVESDPFLVLAHDELANVIVESGRPRRLEDALPHLRRAFEVDPSDLETRLVATWFWALLGDRCDGPGDRLPKELGIGDAVNETEWALTQAPIPMELANAAAIFAKCGRHARAMEVYQRLEALAETSYVSPEIRARARVWLGDMDGVLDLLEEGLRQRDMAMITLTNSEGDRAIRDSLRGNPRFEAIIDSIGLPRSPLKWPAESGSE